MKQFKLDIFSIRHAKLINRAYLLLRRYGLTPPL